MIMQPSRWGEINDEALQKLSILGQLGNLDHNPGSMCICLVDDKCIWLQYPQLIPSNKCDWLRLCVSRKSDMTRRLDQASVVNLNNRLPTSSAYNCSSLWVSTSKTTQKPYLTTFTDNWHVWLKSQHANTKCIFLVIDASVFTSMSIS